MRFDFADRYVTVNGLTIRYWEVGSGESLVLIHGLGVSIESWAWNIEALSAHYRVIALDIPGFGRSSPPSDGSFYQPDNSTRLFYCFLDALGIRRATLVGHSMGGYVAMQVCLRYPHIADRLILVSSAGLGQEIDLFTRLLAVWPLGEMLFQPLPAVIEWMGDRLLSAGLSASYRERMLEFYQSPGAKQSLLNTLRAGVNLNGQFITFSDAELQKLSLPVLLVWGQQDNVLPVQHIHRAAKVMPNSRAAILDQARHAPHIDRAEEFNRLVLDFLSYQPSAISNQPIPKNRADQAYSNLIS